MSIDAVVNVYSHAGWVHPDRWGIGRLMHRYVLWFGAYSSVRVLVYAPTLEEALEDAAQELRDRGWGGLFTEPDYEDALEDLQQKGKIPLDVTWGDISACGVIDAVSGKVLDAAQADLTYTESGWIPSWEWGIMVEDPSRADLLALAHQECDGTVYRNSAGVPCGVHFREHYHVRSGSREKAANA